MTFLLTIIWPFIRSNWKAFAILGAVLALLGVVMAFGAHERHIQHEKDLTELHALQANLSTCHANVTGLQSAITAQNAAVDAAKADSDRRAQMLSDGLKEARRGEASVKARAAGLLAHPAVGVDACARAVSAREAVLRSLN